MAPTPVNDVQERRRRMEQLKSAFESPSSTAPKAAPKVLARKVPPRPLQMSSSQSNRNSMFIQLKPSPLSLTGGLRATDASLEGTSPPGRTPSPDPSSTLDSQNFTESPPSTSPTSSASAITSQTVSTVDTSTSTRPLSLSRTSLSNVELDDKTQHTPPQSVTSEDRSSTLDMDSFSTIVLKTPTTASSPSPTKNAQFGSSGSPLVRNSYVSTTLHDDDVDLGTTHAGSYRTDVQDVDQEEMKTPNPQKDKFVIRPPPSPSRPIVPPSPSASINTNVDFLLKRLDRESNNRASIEGRAKLKEDFQRLQNEMTALASTNDTAAASQHPGDEHAEHTNWEFWGDVVANYEHIARTQAENLARAIQLGIPPALRGMVWQLMSASKDVELEKTYAIYLKQESPHDKAITRDLGRTFPQHSFFMDGQGLGQENLFNVLKAYALYDPEVGYCQGLAFVCAALLLNMPDEEAFCVLVRLMYSYGARDLYLPEMPGLQLRLFQFDRLVEEFLPVLHVHFLRQGVKSSMFCSQWFLTMFSYRFPLDLVFRIFDSVFGHGVEAIFGFSLILLIKNEEKLLQLKFDQILEYMKGELFDYYKIEGSGSGGTDEKPTYRATEFVQDAFSVKITPFQLDNYASEWQELRRAQAAHMTELENLRRENRNLSSQVRELETSLASLNEEHCDIVKELVLAKLAREEVEGELVRYKLMYAEVMHDRADAMSTHRHSLFTTPASASPSRVSSASGSSISFSFGRSS